MKLSNTLIATAPNDGAKLNIAGGKYRIVVSGKQTNGSYAIIEMTVPPGAGPVPHSHPDFEETFYVLEGEVLFTSEEGEFLAQKDALVGIPKGGMIHHFKNNTDLPAKLLCTVIPAGLDEFFTEAQELVLKENNSPVKDPQKMKEHLTLLSEKYGQTLFTPNYFEK